ncbi:solute carrier family 2, facilitated glucose transporter member 1-like isoform X3 [Rhodnius prolixus]|uniref:solute carrier family 2, facilitated glucose transporter member 1-like isoform X3 n=1 Tax=Rhodnius prolixus TaxID=13249 RepID=UPI003D18C1CC
MSKMVVRNGSVLGTESLWPFMLALILVPAIFQVIAFIWAPESPRYVYLKENDSVRLFEVLSRIYSDENIMARMHEVQEDIEDGRGQETLKFSEMLRKPSLRTPLSTVIMLMLVQLLSSINIGVQDAAFAVKELESRTRHYNQSANLLATVVCVFLIDRIGRKMLMLFSLGIMILTTIVIFISFYLIPQNHNFVYISVLAIFLFALGYGLGVAPIPWVIATEMFNTASRVRAVGFCVFVTWFFKLAFSLSVLALQVVLGPAVYLIFMASQTLGFIFAWIFLPETSNMPVSLVTAHFRRQAQERFRTASSFAPRRA